MKFLNGNTCMVPLEVALMLRIQKSANGTSAAVTLLDWYDLHDELILVLERPVPCLDLIQYSMSRRSSMQEREAKVSS